MTNRDDDSIENTEGHKALLSVVKAVVFNGVRHAYKDARSDDEIQSMFGQVGLALDFAPREAHIRNVYTMLRVGKSCLTRLGVPRVGDPLQCIPEPRRRLFRHIVVIVVHSSKLLEKPDPLGRARLGAGP